MRVLQFFALMAATLAPGLEAKELRVLILDGINNHDWEAGSAFLKEVLEGSGKFRVTILTSPQRGAGAEEWAGWQPQFDRYDVVINNFNGGHLKDALRWPAKVEESFLRYVRNGGGVVIFHAANNAFLEWTEYNELVGLLWRDKSYGPGLVVEGTQVVEVPAGQGMQPGHGPRHSFRVDVLNQRHPITQGLGGGWEHASEQLTHGQHGPAKVMKELEILTYAYSKDSKRKEPMDWVRRYGKGRVYVTMLGHTWRGEENPNLRVEGFRRILRQGVEWAASGKVRN